MMTIYEVLADPTRRRILDLLREQPRLVGELVDRLEISQPGVSKHLRVLREAGLVNVRQEAQRHWYELRVEPLVELDSWLSPFRRLWEDRMDRLDEYLQELQRGEQGE
ncbi:MAG: winged helix-turn-helix transcriptional regulator [Anaerolinea sp.]|nr:winged helix-turn-helix transcriptional regulator [Anaerolinea sp.]